MFVRLRLLMLTPNTTHPLALVPRTKLAAERKHPIAAKPLSSGLRQTVRWCSRQLQKRNSQRMLMTSLRAAAASVAVFAASHSASGDVAKLAAESLKTYKAMEAIGAEMRLASNGITGRVRAIESLVRDAGKPAPGPDKIEEYQREIRRLEQQVDHLKLKMEMAKITDAERREARVEELKTELKQLRAKEREVTRPFNDEMNRLKAEEKGRCEQFTEAMERFCRIPGEAYPDVVKTEVHATFHSAFTSYSWRDAEDKQLVWAHVRLRDKPKVPKNPQMLDGAHYIMSCSHQSIWVWAGHFQVAFMMQKKEWQGAEKVEKALKCFIDVDGLAGIDPTKP